MAIDMRYDSIAEFMNAVKDGSFTGSVLVDNDCVSAYLTHDAGETMDVVKVYDFCDRNPEEVLIGLLEYLGVTVEMP